MAFVDNDPPSEKPKILLVDDREDNLLSIEAILEPDGYQFFRAYSGQEALKILLNEFDFAMILMDVKMPVLNGFETATLIHERERLRHIPIIFITANNYGDENVFRGYKAGGIDYIFKPINPEVLRAKVAVFIDVYRKNALLFEQEQKLSAANQSLEAEINDLKATQEKTRHLNTKLQRELHELASILLSSQPSSDLIEFELCDLNKLLKNFLVDMDDHIKEKMATVTIAPMPALNISRVLMRPLFENLIKNILANTCENVKPVIKIRSEIGAPVAHHSSNNHSANKYCHVIVEDNDSGFDLKSAENFNSKNRSLDNDEFNDTNHALTLCKRIMDRHNGHILINRETKEGSAFIVSFPMAN